MSRSHSKLWATRLLSSWLLLIGIVWFNWSCNSQEKDRLDWGKVQEALGDWVGSVSFYYYTHDSADYQIDFFASDEEFFTAIISAKNDKFKIVETFVGYATEHHVYYNTIDSTKFLKGEFQVLYDSLLAINSSWLIVDTVPYWRNGGLRELWNRKKFYVGSKGTKWEAYSTIALK